MAVTPVGNPYVESSDNVADFPGASEALAERIDIVGVNPFANAAARDAAIPSPVQGQMCSLNDDNKGYRYDGSAWVLFSGAGNANFTNAATGTYTDGKDYKYITFPASGELVVDRAGFADILVIGGGAGGGAGVNAAGGVRSGGGGGAGGYLSLTSFYLSEATHAVTVGAGGAAITNGNTSSITPARSIGGGAGGAGGVVGAAGDSGGGGGGGDTVRAGGSGISPFGTSGGSGEANVGGGGGGATAAGSNGIYNDTGGAGGTGTSSSITNVATTRGGGGGGGGPASGAGGAGGGGTGGATNANGTAGTVNTGGGGGGAGQANPTVNPGGAGGSGLVIIRVVV